MPWEVDKTDWASLPVSVKPHITIRAPADESRIGHRTRASKGRCAFRGT